MRKPHSVAVPRLYRLAAKISENINKTGASVKSTIYQAKHPHIKALYALVVETLRHSKQLEFLLKRTKLLEKEPGFNPWMARVLITELLWGKKHLKGECKPIKAILAYQQVINAHVSDVYEIDATENKVKKPRFVRVNTLLIPVKDAVEGFRDEGWTFVRYTDTKNYDGFLDKVANLSENEFMIDMHIPEVLIFPQNTQFYSHNAYKKGLIVLQDKASCLPGHLLNPPPGSAVLDMCAAPGMKTSHLAAKLNNDGRVYAVDMDEKRLKTLGKLMEANGITCVETINKDVLKVTDSSCPNVKYILVDPSCSGSGIVDRIDLVEPTIKNENRIRKLRGFQIMILKHALRRFPNAQRVIYSTCSLYPEENEEVVEEVIKQTAKFKLVNASELLTTPWHNFGSERYGNIGKFCLYSRPEKDLTNGFFVAVFERLGDDEVNEYYVKFEGVKSTRKDSRNRSKNKNESMDANHTEDHIVEDEITEPNENEDLENRSKRQKKKKAKNSSDRNELMKFQHEIQSGNNENIKEKLTDVDIENNKEDISVQGTKKKKKRKAESLNYIIEEAEQNIEDTKYSIPKEANKKKEKKERLENNNNKDIKGNTDIATDDNLLTGNNLAVEDGDAMVKINSEKQKRKKHKKHKKDSFDTLTEIEMENALDNSFKQKDKRIIDKASDDELLNQEEENVTNNGVNSQAKKRKKHASKDLADTIAVEDNNTLQNNEETLIINDESKISKSKKKKRVMEDFRNENLNIDSSFEKTKRKQENTYVTELNSSIYNLIEENEQIEISKKKNKKKKDKKKEDQDQSQTVQDKEDFYDDTTTTPNKTRKGEIELDFSKNKKEVNPICHLEATSKKNKKDRRSIVDGNKNEESTKTSHENDESKSFLGDVNDNMEEIESSKDKKKKKHKKRKSSGEENEDLHGTKADANDIAGDSSSRSIASMIEGSLEASGIKKLKKRRQSTIMEDSFNFDILFGIK